MSNAEYPQYLPSSHSSSDIKCSAPDGALKYVCDEKWIGRMPRPEEFIKPRESWPFDNNSCPNQAKSTKIKGILLF